MAGRRTCDKPLPEPVMTQFIDAYTKNPIKVVATPNHVHIQRDELYLNFLCNLTGRHYKEVPQRDEDTMELDFAKTEC